MRLWALCSAPYAPPGRPLLASVIRLSPPKRRLSSCRTPPSSSPGAHHTAAAKPRRDAVIAAAAAAEATAPDPQPGEEAAAEPAQLPSNPLGRVLAALLPVALLLICVLVVIRVPAARGLLASVYRRYLMMGAPGVRVVVFLMAVLVMPVYRLLRRIFAAPTSLIKLHGLKKEVRQVLQELQEGAPLTEEMIARLQAFSLPVPASWQGTSLRTRTLRDAVHGVLELVQGSALSGPGLAPEVASRLVACLVQVLSLKDKQAGAVVRAEVVVASRGILGAAEQAAGRSAQSAVSAQYLRAASKRLGAVAAAFPLPPDTPEGIELGAAVRRVDIWAAACK